MKAQTKTLIWLILFILSLAGTLLFVISPIIFEIEEPGQGYLVVSVFCGTVGFPVTLAFYALWRKSKKVKSEVYKDVATFIKMYRRTPLSEVAKRFNVSEKEAENLVLKAVEMKYLKAYIDRETNEIVTSEAIKATKVVRLHCPNCGAEISGVYLPGEVVVCPYCGTKFKVVK